MKLHNYKDRDIDILRVLKEDGVMPNKIKQTELYSLIRKMDSNMDIINQNLTEYLNGCLPSHPIYRVRVPRTMILKPKGQTK